MLATCHQRFLALFVGRSETVEDLTKDEGYNGERKEDIGEQVTIGKSLAGEVHHQVEAGEVVALAHGLLSVAQPNIQLAPSWDHSFSSVFQNPHTLLDGRYSCERKH